MHWGMKTKWQLFTKIKELCWHKGYHFYITSRPWMKDNSQFYKSSCQINVMKVWQFDAIFGGLQGFRDEVWSDGVVMILMMKLSLLIPIGLDKIKCLCYQGHRLLLIGKATTGVFFEGQSPHGDFMLTYKVHIWFSLH